MDTTALLAAIIGVACGAAVTYQAMKRHWCAASGLTALEGAVLMNIVTTNNRSHFKHRVVIIVSLILFLFGWVAITLPTNVRQCND